MNRVNADMIVQVDEIGTDCHDANFSLSISVMNRTF